LYQTLNGRAALVRAPQLGDKALPFGVDVVDGGGHTLGVVVQDGRIFARGLEDKGSLFVKWGSAASEQCKIDYVLPKPTTKAATAHLSAEGDCGGGMSEQAVHASANHECRANLLGLCASRNCPRGRKRHQHF
jgi:outer membrane usher protein